MKCKYHQWYMEKCMNCGMDRKDFQAGQKERIKAYQASRRKKESKLPPIFNYPERIAEHPKNHYENSRPDCL